MPSLQNKVIIVTGASAGIGEATAYELAKTDAKIVITARRYQKLIRTSKKMRPGGAEVLVVKADLNSPVAIDRLIERTFKRFGRVDVLVNIAAWGSYAWIETQSYKDLSTQFAVNVLGAAYLIRKVVPIMKKQRAGHVINMVSYASRIAVPPQTIYASTKYALEGLSDGLRRELAPWGIRVSRIHPSGVPGTEFNAKASRRGGVHFDSPGIGNVSKQAVARAVRRLIEHPKRERMIGRLYDVPAFLNRYAPWTVDLFMKTWVAKKRRKELKQQVN